MHTQSILVITALAFGLHTSIANAEPRQGHPHSHSPAPRPQAKKDANSDSSPQQHASDKPHAASKPAPVSDRGRGVGPDRHLVKGDRLRANQRGRQDVIDDWREHRLSAPPRGQHWMQLGADYALVAISTGIITQIVFGN